jgi:signal transduction histidine kinase
VGDEVIAVLVAEDPQRDAFTEADLRIFEAIGAQLGVVMENARLFEAEREQRRLVEQSQAQLVQSEKLAATGRLAASLTHEINNPLQAIRSGLQLVLSSEMEPEEQRVYLEMANEEVERLQQIVSRTLDFARRPRWNPVYFDPHTVIERILALSNKYRQHRHVTLKLDLMDNPPIIRGVPDELEQVFLNLVLNAVEAMPEGGTLRISSSLEEERLAISFTDTGQGIPPQHLSHIFDPFFSTKEESTGLGLSISYDIVERHEGQITVESEVDEGSTFTVWLPIVD